MNQQDYYRNELQMNYFSEEYRHFEEDFYRYSSLTIPLTFLIDDVYYPWQNQIVLILS